MTANKSLENRLMEKVKKLSVKQIQQVKLTDLQTVHFGKHRFQTTSRLLQALAKQAKRIKYNSNADKYL